MEVEIARAFGATWRDQASGEVVGITSSSTMCWWPVKPWRVRIARGGDELIIPCRKCPGCLEFYRRRLADRLVTKYGKRGRAKTGDTTTARATPASASATRSETLYLVRIWARLSQHARICHDMHRSPSLDLEPGMYRLGTTSFAVIARTKPSLPGWLRRRHIEYRIEPIRLSRGRRAWKSLTAGMLVAREAYGEQVKRFYAMGLPPAERERWEVVKLGAYKAHRRVTDPRVWKRGNVILVPPDVWKLGRTDRRSVQGLFRTAGSPEALSLLSGILAKLVSGIGAHQNLTAPAEGRLTEEQVRNWYAAMARKKQAGASASPESGSLAPLLGGERYSSSVQSGNSPNPADQVRAALQRQREERDRRLRREFDETVERLRKKIGGER